MQQTIQSHDVDSPRYDGRSDAFIETFQRYLVDQNLLDAASYDRARRAAIKTGQRIDHVLLQLGLLPEQLLLEALSHQFGMLVAADRDVPHLPVLPEAIHAQFIYSRHVVPLCATDRQLTIAVVDPFDDEPQRALAYLTGLEVKALLISMDDFARAVKTLYCDERGTGERSLDARIEEANDVDIQRLRDIANEAPIIRLVNQIIGDAVDSKSSDIHIEPGVDEVTIRYRIDGHLRPTKALASGLRAAVTSRVKIMAKLDIAERRKPQDGRIKISVRGIEIDFRVSTIPTAYGESVVMRVLDRSRVDLDFAALGFDSNKIAALERLMQQPNGIILVTGPTGSGKTTTLYAALRRLNRPNIKLFTVEDPIEYQIPGINQVQVHAAIDFEFPEALRSILRQDPDVIMIGEMRDLETARIGIQASLTGHLVFSTLHTNSAAAAVTRLVDIGIENYLLASTLNGILAQRLVRRLCTHCARPHSNADHWRARLSSEARLPTPQQEMRILEAVGCETCHHTGFNGRLSITELLVFDNAMRRLVLSEASDVELEAAARQSGMRTIFEDGLSKIGQGLTTIDEVLRATRPSS